MGDKTAIEWADSTWNPIRGTKGNWSCVKVSEGCAHCYAERFNVRQGGPEYTVGADTLRLDLKSMEIPLRWKRPRRIFVGSMTDLFEERVPDEWIGQVFGIMLATRDSHTYQILTKRAERLHGFISKYSSPGGPLHPWPLLNVWLGVSVENQARADERIPWLLQTPAAVRFLSVEPLLTGVDLSRWLPIAPRGNQWQRVKVESAYGEQRPRISWVITGGESGGPPERALVKRTCACGDWQEDHVDGRGACRMPDDINHGYRPCKTFRPAGFDLKHEAVEWLRSLRDQCQAAGVAFFHKQNGGPTPKSGGRLLDGKEWSEFPP